MKLLPVYPAAFAISFFLSGNMIGAARGASTSQPASTPEPEAKEQASPEPPAHAPTPSGAVENSVVKVFATVRYPDYYKPWTKQSPTDVSGSGVIISGKRILTNAHVVLYASEVQIQANQAGDKIPATVQMIAPGIDLAILKLDDESFFDSRPPLAMAKTLPEIRDSVTVYGYPTGGNSLSATRGIVSRIEFRSYRYPTAGLKIQIDAAINDGNSGGPAVVDDKMIGLAFSRLNGSESIGYIIPTEEIALFLSDIADGRYDGKPTMLDATQTLENPALRAFLKLNSSATGIIVHQPASDAPDYPLKEWDLITHIGDAVIDDQGMIKLRSNLRISYLYLVQKIANQGRVPLTIIRAGKELHIDLPVSADQRRVVPDLLASSPSYFILGPLIFSEATSQLLNDYADGNKAADWLLDLAYMRSPLLSRVMDRPAFEGERIVFVSSPFIPHKLAKGYSNPSQEVVKSINGVRVKNLAHLVQTLRDMTDEFIAIEYDMRGGETTIFPRAAMIEATEPILNDNGIRSQGSPDLLALWNAKH